MKRGVLILTPASLTLAMLIAGLIGWLIATRHCTNLFRQLLETIQ